MSFLVYGFWGFRSRDTVVDAGVAASAVISQTVLTVSRLCMACAQRARALAARFVVHLMAPIQGVPVTL